MLIRKLAADHVYLVCGYTDMRKSVDGLAMLVQANHKLDPFTSSMFIFCGKRKDRIKALLWDRNGFLLLYKRLENGRYKWPMDRNEAKEIDSQQLRWLTEGLSIHQPGAVKNVKPHRAC